MLLRCCAGALALAVLMLLGGCPAPPQESAPAPAPDGQAALPKPDAGPAPEAPPAETAPDPPAQATDTGSVPPRQYPLELAGVQLGRSYDEVYAALHAKGQPRISGIWADKKGVDGVLQVSPSNGDRLPANDYCIIGGKCVGYFKRFEMSDADYMQLLKDLVTLNDPATETVPQWAAGDAVVRGLPKLSGIGHRVFWSDEGRGELLIAQREDPSGRVFFCLYRPAACAALGLEYSDFASAFGPYSSTPVGQPGK